MRTLAPILAGLATITLAACANSSPCESDSMAFTMASEIVGRQLGPTAEIASITESTITRQVFDGQCGFTIVSHIDGQNVFGGPVRQQFIADVVPDSTGKEWSMRALQIF